MRHFACLSLATLFVASGCRNSGDSMTTSLGEGLKPEGFLVIKEVVAESDRAGFFKVTCASAGGDKEAVYSQTEIEQNKVCVGEPVKPQATVPAGEQNVGQVETSRETLPTAQATRAGGEQSGSFTINLEASSTYLKKTPNFNVSASRNAQLGIDFCVMNITLKARSVCKSGSEFRVTGVSIPGCSSLTSGYLYESHVSVMPPVDDCP